MSDYRKAIKEHFEAIPALQGMLAVNYVFYGIGLVLYIIGGFLTSYIAADLLICFGLLLIGFGLFLSFVKRDDLSVMIIFFVYAFFQLVFFIYTLVAGRGYVIPISRLLYLAVAVFLGILALKSSGKLSEMQRRKIEQTAAMMQQMQQQASMSRCPNCGAAMAPQAQFCPACGAKKPEPMKCPSCGAPASEQDTFCNSCGAKLK